MTRLAPSLLLGVILLVCAAPAAAIPSVDLFFTELNGSPIPDTTALQVRSGDQLVAGWIRSPSRSGFVRC